MILRNINLIDPNNGMDFVSPTDVEHEDLAYVIFTSGNSQYYFLENFEIYIRKRYHLETDHTLTFLTC